MEGWGPSSLVHVVKSVALKCCARKHRPGSTAGEYCGRKHRERIAAAFKMAPAPMILEREERPAEFINDALGGTA